MNTQKFRLLGILLLFSFAGFQPSFSQEIVGTGQANGQIVELFENFTWRYKEQSQSNKNNCDTLSGNISFCNIGGWRISKATGDANAMYVIDGRHYAMFIIENVGAEDGFSLELMQDVALGYAAEAANIQKSSVPILNRQTVSVDNKKLLSLGYSATIDNVNFTYQNNIYVGADFTMQAIVFGVGNATKKMQDHNEILLQSIKIID